jgi:iron complex transport system substrate-binding protein
MRTKIVFFIVSIATSFMSIADPITLSHQLGNVTLESKPARVAVIGLGVLDALDRFNIDPIAVTKAIQMPDYLSKYQDKRYASTGSLFEPDFETIYNQKPDVIIIGIRSTPHYAELSKIAPTIVFAIDDTQSYWLSTQQQWRNLGKLFDIEDRVEQQIARIDTQFQQIVSHNQSHQSDALTVMSSGGNITAFGVKSRFATIYQDFGFASTVDVDATSPHGDLISFEFIRKANPSTLLIIDRDKLNSKAQSSTEKDFDNALVHATKAHQEGRIAFLDLNAWYLSIAGVTATERMIQDIKRPLGLD